MRCPRCDNDVEARETGRIPYACPICDFVWEMGGWGILSYWTGLIEDEPMYVPKGTLPVFREDVGEQREGLKDELV